MQKLWKLGLLTVLLSIPADAQTPVTTHPRLWLTSADLSRLRSWAVSTNPVYQDGLAVLAATAKGDMDAGRVPAQDTGSFTYVDYPSEMYAELFAFMSLISPDQATRDDFAQRARTLLMSVINQAAQGAAAGVPFRDPEFSINDRSRWHGEGFALTVDWIYPYLSAADKTAIRQVFLRWIDELLNATVTAHDHPVPIGTINDPVLTSDRNQLRWSGNNYFLAHMRNIGLMSMALDDADDPGGTLRGYLSNATGAWLYIVDELMRSDCRGGVFPEGFEYSPQALAYIVQFTLAMHTAGVDNPATYGQQVDLASRPFWDDLITSYFHSISPATSVSPTLRDVVYLPAWYGDGLNYWAGDPIALFGALALYDQLTGNATRAQTLRWLQINVPPGGPATYASRANDGNFFQHGILYFLLFDPAAAAPSDPRPSLPLMFFAPGLGRLLARTDWTANATWLTYKLSWNVVDHQNGDGNQFEFYRRGEWLTKEQSGYDLDYGASLHHNTLTIENSPVSRPPDDYRSIQQQLGSQWTYVAAGDPTVVARSSAPGFVYITGDTTPLYNSDYESSTDVAHASRSLFWLQPDHIVVYDRAESLTAGRFKRFWLNTPAQAVVSGSLSTVTTASGQRLFVTTVLPAVTPTTESAINPVSYGDIAADDPMRFRLRVDAPGNPTSARFLHVLQGADAGGTADAVTPIQNSSGTPYSGAAVHGNAILFPVTLGGTFNDTTFGVATSVAAYWITGLTPGAGYTVNRQTNGATATVTVTAGGTSLADSGGVLLFRPGGLRGDANGDGNVAVADVFYLINFLFAGGASPIGIGDANSDGSVTVADVFFLINYLFAAGPAPA